MNTRYNIRRTDGCTEGGFAKTSPRFGVVTAQGGWRKVTGRRCRGGCRGHRGVIDGAERCDCR